jgi:hypothetical protein
MRSRIRGETCFSPPADESWAAHERRLSQADAGNHLTQRLLLAVGLLGSPLKLLSPRASPRREIPSRGGRAEQEPEPEQELGVSGNAAGATTLSFVSKRSIETLVRVSKKALRKAERVGDIQGMLKEVPHPLRTLTQGLGSAFFIPIKTRNRNVGFIGVSSPFPGSCWVRSVSTLAPCLPTLSARIDRSLCDSTARLTDACAHTLAAWQPDQLPLPAGE